MYNPYLKKERLNGAPAKSQVLQIYLKKHRAFFRQWAEKDSFHSSILNHSKILYTSRKANTLHILKLVRESIPHFFRPLVVFFLLIFYSNCTTIGIHNQHEYSKFDFKGDIKYRICIFKEPSLAESRVRSLMDSLQSELNLFNLRLDWKIVGERERPGFFTAEIFESLERTVLLESCDRMLLLLKRDIGDFFFHFLFPEILGLVDANTRTRGFVFADYLSINILFGSTPGKVLIHENYHFLGCDHHWIMNECYDRIYSLRREILKSPEKKMFPTYVGEEKIILDSPELINQIILKSLEKKSNQRN